MSDEDPPEITWDEDVPDEPPPAEGGDGTEVADQPLGAPAEMDPDDAPLPGLPESEPPNSG